MICPVLSGLVLATCRSRLLGRRRRWSLRGRGLSAREGSVNNPSHHPAIVDTSNGYEAVAEEFLRRREPSVIGVETVRMWSGSLPPGGTILDLGCGSGVPIATTLDAEGFRIHGVDASRFLVDAFRRRLPHARAACEAVGTSDFFGRTFDGVVAIGLIFLLAAQEQCDVIHKVARVLNPQGRFLFSAPAQPCTWTDVLTGQVSRSLGPEAYRTVFRDAGLLLAGEYQDEGGNHYLDVTLSAEHAPRADPPRHAECDEVPLLT